MTDLPERPSHADTPRLAPSRVLRIYGMRRSGNHAIINWLQRNAPTAGSIFLNNCHARRDPIASHRSVEVFAEWTALEMARDTPLGAQFAAAGQDPLVLVSVEDAMPPAQGQPFAPLFETAVETVLVIYRSFLNWSASLLRKISGNRGYGPLARARVMTAAMTTYAAALERVSEAAKRGFVAICYDTWHASAPYRAGLLDSLGFGVRDNTRGAVQRYGGGSSFQPGAQEAEALQTDQRAAQMTDDPEYQNLLRIAAQDRGFLAALAPHFPADAAWLEQLASAARTALAMPKGAPA